jgi:hypothetical protein
MKATKNQANAVRAYLATLGLSISHVQALEVIARGAGLRSRHVQEPISTLNAPAAAAASAPAAPRDAFGEALALRERYWEQGLEADTEAAIAAVETLLPGLFGSQKDIEGFLEATETVSVSVACEEMSQASALWYAYVQAGRTAAAQANALTSLVQHCGERFGSIEEAYLFLLECDQAAQRLAAVPATAAQASKPAPDMAEEDAMATLSDAIRAEYQGSGCQRCDLEHAVQRLLAECAELFDGEEAAVAFLHESAEPQAASPAPAAWQLEMVDVSGEMARAEEIKAEYDSSRCHADDVDHAVQRLQAECPLLYGDGRKAWGFINEEPHEETEGTQLVIQVESDLFGHDLFTYYTEEERRAGLIRLMAKAVELNDGGTRRYYFTDIDGDVEKHSPEYDEALHTRELEGEIVDNVVFYQGNRIGTIADITEGDLTLHSWIDDNP